MDLLTCIQRPVPPDDWTNWSKIPWDAPDFSRRMLDNHLCQDHDWASRNRGIIASQAALIHARLPEGGRILDLGCGPGLYTQALHALGHPCTGVDFSPASIRHAQSLPGASGNTYVLEDIRRFRPAERFDAVLLLFGEINAFARAEASGILATAAQCLAPGGTVFVEVHTEQAVRDTGSGPPIWRRLKQGLFSDAPHLYLEEHFWNGQIRVAMTRYSIIDAASAEVAEYASLMQAYTNDEYIGLFNEVGLHAVTRLPDPDWPAGADFEGKLFCFACGL